MENSDQNYTQAFQPPQHNTQPQLSYGQPIQGYLPLEVEARNQNKIRDLEKSLES